MAEIKDLVDIAHETAVENDRDPEAIEMTAGHPGLFGDDPVSAAEELASIGVTLSIIPAFMMLKGPTAEMAEGLAEKIIRPCAAA